jgi:hypothetical protein
MTRVAAIVSARAYHDAVPPGYAADAPENYVPAPVEVKKLVGTGYLRVPSPSGDLLRDGFLPRINDPKVIGSGDDESRRDHEGEARGEGPRNTYNFQDLGFVHGGTGDQNNRFDNRRP